MPFSRQVYILTSGSSASIWFSWILSVMSHWSTTSWNGKSMTGFFSIPQESRILFYLSDVLVDRLSTGLTMILLFSSLSMYWSLNIWQEPNTASLPASFTRHETSINISQVCIHKCSGNGHENYIVLLTFPWWKARTGLLRGKQTEPVERMATAGFITLSVAPYGYTNVRALHK